MAILYCVEPLVTVRSNVSLLTEQLCKGSDPPPIFCLKYIYRISSYNFRPWIVSAHLYTVTFGLMYCDLWISKPKKIVSAETIWRNTVGKTCSIKWSYIGKQMPPSPPVPKDFQTFLRPWVRRAGASFLQRGRKNSAPSIHSAEFFFKMEYLKRESDNYLNPSLERTLRWQINEWAWLVVAMFSS